MPEEKSPKGRQKKRKIGLAQYREDGCFVGRAGWRWSAAAIPKK